ncbi:MAG: MFS transporter [Bacteroidales bacterium]|nr:MFS transporter [Bacteroidales bacterium]
MATNFKKDIQYYRFSLYGFLKNQKFYEPFFLLFLLSRDISYFEAGLLYSIREVTINLAEIPAGVLADSSGRRRTMLFSFSFYIFSFLSFYFSHSFHTMAVAMILFGMGDVFRTGTHKAMIFDYLDTMGWSHDRVVYYGNTRSWSQRGSALSSLIAAAAVVLTSSYSLVFLFAIVPYLLNFINLATYPAWLDGDNSELTWEKFRKSFREVFISLKKTMKRAAILRIYTNSTLISAWYNSAKDYLQPLLAAFAVSLPFFKGMEDSDRSAITVGIVYFFIFLITSKASRLSGRFALATGSDRKAMNLSYLLFGGAALGSGLLYYSGHELAAVVLFVAVYAMENLRRPAVVAVIASNTDKKALSTYLSIDSQLKSLFTMVMSPLVGLAADKISPGAGVALLSVLVLILYPIVRLRKE